MPEYSNAFLDECADDQLHFTVELECLHCVEFEFDNIKAPSITLRVHDHFQTLNIGAVIIAKIHELKLTRAELIFLESDCEFSYSFDTIETIYRNANSAFKEALKFIETKVSNDEFMEPQEFIVESEYPHLQVMRIRVNPVIVPSTSVVVDGFTVPNSLHHRKNVCTY